MRSLHTEASTHDQSRPCLSAPCVALWGTADAWLSPLLRCGTHASTFLPPVPQHSFAFCASRDFRRFGTMKALTPAPFTTHSAVSPLTSPHLPVVPPPTTLGCLDIASPTTPACPASFGLRHE